MIKQITEVFTESDNKTHSLMKYLVFGGTIAALFYQGWDIVGNHLAFNMQTFGLGIGAMWAGAAAALGLQKESPCDHTTKD